MFLVPPYRSLVEVIGYKDEHFGFLGLTVITDIYTFELLLLCGFQKNDRIVAHFFD